MDEGGTLDFDDLMDTGDVFPGFEIAKFTAANETDEKDDGVLRTPEHEKDDDDYIVSEHKTKHTVYDGANDNSFSKMADGEVKRLPGIGVGIDDKHGDSGASGDHIMGMMETADEMVEPSESDPGDDDKPDATGDHAEVLGNGDPDAMGDDREVIEDSKPDHIGDDERDDLDTSRDGPGEVDDKPVEDTHEVSINDDESEPAPKKKKIFLLPPKPKTTLVSSSNSKEQKSADSHDAESERISSDNEDSEGCHDAVQNGEREEMEEKDGETSMVKEEEEEEEEDPHQQSFLSFLNLKPGASKPKTDEMKKEENMQNEFFSRKRLRTRKKVSYCEDVAQADDDEEYNEDGDEDEEEEYDHQIDLTSPQRRRTPVRQNSRSPAKSTATATYAKALQNLLPGVDLACLQPPRVPAPPQKVLNMNNVPRMGPKSVMNNIVAGLRPQGNLKGLFECGLCGTFFNTASQFITHQETAHTIEQKNGRSAMETFRCEVCGFVLTNRFAYLEHKKMKHNKGSGGGQTYTCNKCKMSKFTDIAALQKHQQVCGTPFCSTCGATFKAWVEVAEHRKQAHASITASTRQWLNCVNKTCTFKCVTQHEMRQHIQAKHMVNELFSCNAPRCSRVFSTREHLTEHKKEAHASEFIVQYQCMECKNCFSSKTLLAEHQYLHTLEKLRKCDLCSRQFSTITDLRRHKDIHAVKGTIKCQSCSRWCVDKLELVNHVCAQKRRNTGIRLYFCDVCHKDFRSDEKMFIHRKEHKNFFQCVSCFWECKSEAEYFEHREVHGKYTCKECCEELEERDVEMHAKAHKYYIKLEEMENDGKQEKVMFLCPNLINTIQA